MSGMNLNTILMILVIISFVAALVLLYIRSKRQTNKADTEIFNSIDKVLEAVKIEMVEIVKDDIGLGISNDEFDRLYKRKARINDALKNCVHGVDSAKALVIDLIRNFIASKVPHEQITELLGLSEDSEPSNHVKFEMIMYKYKKQYGKDAMQKWIDKYDFARERIASYNTSGRDLAYYITVEDLENSFSNESFNFDIEEQIDLLAVLVYQQYKGFGILDTLREMNINGFNIGTSGSIMDISANSNLPNEFKAANSVWIYYQGKYIHLRFMNFGSEDEARRIIQMICRWNNPGPLTAKRGYLVNTMYDKSRVLALRPPVSEYWAVFVRKFNISDPSPEQLIIKEYTKRGDLAIHLIEYLMRGCITSAVTGRQGSGKTTLMSSIMRFVDPRYTIRVLELAPELYLRELYPSRNILSVEETNTVSAAECQDALKKSDAAISIVGEVATDAVAARMIQFAQVASIFSIFSHHANTSKDLVLALRNSLVNAGGFGNMQVAEKQVTDVVKVDVHLDYTASGKRYIARISEIVPIEEGIPYPEYNENDGENSINRITAEYYRRQTDRISFLTHDIMRYDLDTDTYYTVDRFSRQLEEKIRNNLTPDIRKEFDQFVLSEWGPRKDGEENIHLEDYKDSETSDERAAIISITGEAGSNLSTDSTVTGESAEAKDTENNVRSIETASNSTTGQDSSVSSTPTGDDIARQAEENSFWKRGYIDNEGDSSTPEFQIGEFFSDDDYS